MHLCNVLHALQRLSRSRFARSLWARAFQMADFIETTKRVEEMLDNDGFIVH
jgi:hypothetical protein